MRAGIIATCAATLLVSSCDDPCGNRPVDEVVSPDGERSAVLFVRDCGATTGYSLQMSLVPTGADLPNDGGNVLILGDGSGWAAGEPTSDAVIGRWTSETTLELVLTEPKENIIFLAESVEGVMIRRSAKREDR